MKKYLPMLLGAFGLCFAAFAEGASATDTAVQGILSAGQTALEGLLSYAIPILSALIVAGLTIWGGFKLIPLIMKSFGIGTKR